MHAHTKVTHAHTSAHRQIHTGIQVHSAELLETLNLTIAVLLNFIRTILIDVEF